MGLRTYDLRCRLALAPQVALLCALVHGAACIDTESLDNDRGSSETLELGAQSNPAVDGGSGDTAMAEQQAAAGAEVVAGTADEAGCSSASLAADGMCAGFYCGVSEETLAAVIPADARCTANPAYVCEGELPKVVGACTRTAKATMPSATDDELQQIIAACANEDSRVREVSGECLSCFVDVALCAATHCLLACLSGDSPDCDRCQRDNACVQPVFACSGLPSPL